MSGMVLLDKLYAGVHCIVCRLDDEQNSEMGVALELWRLQIPEKSIILLYDGHRPGNGPNGRKMKRFESVLYGS